MRRGLLTEQPPRRPALEPALPLINVVFLLLVFFMVAGQVAPNRIDVQPPETRMPLAEEADSLLLTLDRDGNLSQQGEALTLADLPALLPQPEEGTDKMPPVRLLTDADTRLDAMRPVLTALQQAGVREVRLVSRSAP
ncbi:ExbD/TolR family protein [Isoalcanivorax indicus]|uniref:ExbD/TolR family protein n=1 Tax=Isoalcanivorax indicus TaxID=2202653 RepID=UPI000DBA732D|nr:biopolymer transporter ExbD [Isoalcanivorax indicus]